MQPPRAMPDTQISELERRIESVIAQQETSAAKARLLRSIPGIGTVCAAMLIAEMPELGRMTADGAAACHNPVLKPIAQRPRTRGKPHNSSSSRSPADSPPSQTQSSKRASHGSLNRPHEHSC
ncbi:transposase [Paracoccus halophilus]|uniref:transposase n=1 Tax=Paracoccus halophilus TaxID=376733 RepID=UPI0009DE3F11